MMRLHRQVNPDTGKGSEHGDFATDEGELPGWAHEALLEGLGRRLRRLSLHKSVYLSRRASMPDRGVERSRLSLYGSASLKGVPEGLVEAAEPKPIAGGFRPGGHGAATVQQQLGLLAEHQSK